MSFEAARPVVHRYGARSAVVAGEGAEVSLSLDSARAPVGYRARVLSAGLFRDAVMTAATVHASDMRFKSRDRAAYLAYLLKKGKGASKEIWEAQKSFLMQSMEADEKPSTTLDPLFTVHPDQCALEVFSQDESAYGALSLSNAMFDAREALHGSSFVDLSPALTESLERMRTFGAVTLSAAARAPASEEGAVVKKIEVPHRWLRGFLQVQSAATLPAAVCELAPIDLYNVLFALRARKAKTSPRALRFELVPGAPPRLVVEPWEIVLEGHAGAYKGSAPRVIRTYGRQRLMSLARLLPHARSVRVHLLGAGLPMFWVVDMGHATFTLGLTGWTESGWSSAAAFDALTPSEEAHTLADRVHGRLVAAGPSSLESLRQSAGASSADLRAALQVETLRGCVTYDLATGLYRPRNLFPEPIDVATMRYGSDREARAHRLLEGAGQVTLTKLHDVVGEGFEIHGEVNDREAHRSFNTHFMLDLEGRVSGASCGCPAFRRTGMREGPCEHMIAIRILYARKRAEEERMRQTPEGRKLIRAETRTLVRRDGSGREVVYRVSLDDRVVRVQWGARAETSPREQRLWFDTDREARDAYFTRMDSLAGEGFIDAEHG